MAMVSPITGHAIIIATFVIYPRLNAKAVSVLETSLLSSPLIGKEAGSGKMSILSLEHVIRSKDGML